MAKSANEKKPSKQFSQAFGHTPVSIEENIPWKCHRLVIGTGAYGRLHVMEEVKREAERRKVELVVLPAAKAIEILNGKPKATNAILCVTCCGVSTRVFCTCDSPKLCPCPKINNFAGYAR